jgi:hypothetical protein
MRPTILSALEVVCQALRFQRLACQKDHCIVRLEQITFQELCSAVDTSFLPREQNCDVHP